MKKGGIETIEIEKSDSEVEILDGATGGRVAKKAKGDAGNAVAVKKTNQSLDKFVDRALTKEEEDNIRIMTRK